MFVLVKYRSICLYVSCNLTLSCVIWLWYWRLFLIRNLHIDVWGSSKNLPTGRKEERFRVSDFSVGFCHHPSLEPLPRLGQQSHWGNAIHVNLLRTQGSFLRCQGRNRLRILLHQEPFQILIWKGFSCDMLRYPPVCCAPDCFSSDVRELRVFSWNYCPSPNLSTQVLGLPDNLVYRHYIALQYASSLSTTSRQVRSTAHRLPR